MAGVRHLRSEHSLRAPASAGSRHVKGGPAGDDGAVPSEAALSHLAPEALSHILEVTRGLAAPFDLVTMLTRVIDAARSVLSADRGTVYVYDADTDELMVTVGTGLSPSVSRRPRASPESAPGRAGSSTCPTAMPIPGSTPRPG